VAEGSRDAPSPSTSSFVGQQRRDVSAAAIPVRVSTPAGGIPDVSVDGPEIAAKWLAHPRADFADAAAYVLKKNAELYRRLA
jgi:hypothetical protein